MKKLLALAMLCSACNRPSGVVFTTTNTLKAPPIGSQEHVNIAMAIYAIKLPAFTLWPVFDPSLEDRGVTNCYLPCITKEVRIGPEAFESWALLGSTLAHEVEVHSNQSFLLILASLPFTKKLLHRYERQAYNHELLGSKRFGLSTEEVIGIKETRDLFYPIKGDSSK